MEHIDRQLIEEMAKALREKKDMNIMTNFKDQDPDVIHAGGFYPIAIIVQTDKYEFATADMAIGFLSGINATHKYIKGSTDEN